jgi:hypothetical protein
MEYIIRDEKSSLKKIKNDLNRAHAKVLDLQENAIVDGSGHEKKPLLLLLKKPLKRTLRVNL